MFSCHGRCSFQFFTRKLGSDHERTWKFGYPFSGATAREKVFTRTRGLLWAHFLYEFSKTVSAGFNLNLIAATAMTARSIYSQICEKNEFWSTLLSTLDSLLRSILLYSCDSFFPCWNLFFDPSLPLATGFLRSLLVRVRVVRDMHLPVANDICVASVASDGDSDASVFSTRLVFAMHSALNETHRVHRFTIYFFYSFFYSFSAASFIRFIIAAHSNDSVCARREWK